MTHTPVVPGSDNFTAGIPSLCDTALDEWTFVLDSAGLHAPPAPNSPVVYLNPDARISFQNNTSTLAKIRFPKAIFALNGVDLPPGILDVERVIRYTVIPIRGRITCSDLGNGSGSALDICVCPTSVI